MNSQFASKFHLSLDVDDLEDSVDFYTTLFGIPPAVFKPDYVVYDIDMPALHLTLQKKQHCCLQGLNQMGLHLNTRDELMTMKTRLVAHGFKAGYFSTAGFIATDDQAQQDTFWVRDPSKYRWKVSVVNADCETADN